MLLEDNALSNSVSFLRQLWCFIGNLLFWSAYPILREGINNRLNETHLPSLSQKDDPLEIRREFWQVSKSLLYSEETPTINGQSLPEPITPTTNNISVTDTVVEQYPSLFKVLHKLISPSFYFISILLMITTVTGTVQPLMLKWILVASDSAQISPESIDSTSGFGWARGVLIQRLEAVAALLILCLASAIMGAQYGYRLNVHKARITCALTMALYDKILGTDMWHETFSSPPYQYSETTTTFTLSRVTRATTHENHIQSYHTMTSKGKTPPPLIFPMQPSTDGTAFDVECRPQVLRGRRGTVELDTSLTQSESGTQPENGTLPEYGTQRENGTQPEYGTRSSPVDICETSKQSINQTFQSLSTDDDPLKSERILKIHTAKSLNKNHSLDHSDNLSDIGPVSPALEGIILKKPRCFKSSITGDVINLAMLDAERLANALPSINSFWQIPLDLGITFFLLYREVRSAFLAGVGILISSVLLNTIIVSQLNKQTKLMMKWKDVRISLMSECVNGMTTVKLLGLEDALGKRIAEARAKEMNALKARKYLDAVCVYLWAATPVLMICITFGLRLLTGDTLTPPVVFTSMSLLLRLIVPMNNAPWIVSQLIEAKVSYYRLSSFLGASTQPEFVDLNFGQAPTVFETKSCLTPESSQPQPTVEPARLSSHSSIDQSPTRHRLHSNIPNSFEPKDLIVSFKNVTLSPLGLSTTTKLPLKRRMRHRLVTQGNRRRPQTILSDSFETRSILREIELDIYVGDLLLIVGKVGEGKSSFLKAILGEANVTTGQILVQHNTLFVRTLNLKPFHSIKNDFFNFIPLDFDSRPLIAYAPQTPYLKLSSIRDNIIGDFPFDANRYNSILQATGLSLDLHQLPAGDNSPVGESGLLLSGGQRTRIGIARCLYPQNTRLYLLDDFTASLDAHVALNLWNSLFGNVEVEKAERQQDQLESPERSTNRGEASRVFEYQTEDSDYSELETPFKYPLINPETSATVVVTHSFQFLRRLALTDLSRRQRHVQETFGVKSKPWFCRIRVLRLQDGKIDFLGPLNDFPDLWADNSDNKILKLSPKSEDQRSHFSKPSRSKASTFHFNILLPVPKARTFSIDILPSHPTSTHQTLVSFPDAPLSPTIMCSKSHSQSSDLFQQSSVGETCTNSREPNQVGTQVQFIYIVSAGLCISVGVGFSFIFMQLFRNLIDLSLSFWLAGKFPFGIFSGRYSSLSIFLSCYGLLALIHSLITIIRAFGFAKGALNAAEKLHDHAWNRALKGSLSYYSLHSTSSLINRLSTDVWTVDDSLPFTLNIFITQAAALLGGIITLGLASPISLVLLLPLIILYVILQSFINNVRRNLRIIIVSQYTSNWFGLRLEFIGAAFTAGVALVAVLSTSHPTPLLGSNSSSSSVSPIISVRSEFKPILFGLDDANYTNSVVDRLLVNNSIWEGQWDDVSPYYMKILKTPDDAQVINDSKVKYSNAASYNLVLKEATNVLENSPILYNMYGFPLKSQFAYDSEVVGPNDLILDPMTKFTHSKRGTTKLRSSNIDLLQSSRWNPSLHQSQLLEKLSQGEMILNTSIMTNEELDDSLLTALQFFGTNIDEFDQDNPNNHDRNQKSRLSGFFNSSSFYTEEKQPNSASMTFIGLAISYAIPIVGLLNGLFHSSVDTERNFISVERLTELTKPNGKSEIPVEEWYDINKREINVSMKNSMTDLKNKGSRNRILDDNKIPLNKVHLFNHEFIVSNTDSISSELSSDIIKSIIDSNDWPIYGEIRLNDVSVIYPNSASHSLDLRGSTVVISERPYQTENESQNVKRDCIGLVGRTGSGKSTLINALFRLVELQTGTIMIDGVPINQVPIPKLRSSMVTVPQEPVVFSGLTIRENLDPNNRLKENDAAIWEAIELCGLETLIKRHHQGLNAVVGSIRIHSKKDHDNDNDDMRFDLSHGEKQLLCFCRAILRKCRILILDEASSSLDVSHEMLLHGIIAKLKESVTIIIVSHRLDIIVSECDQVIVLERGKVKEFGSPLKLLQNQSSRFAALWSAQHVSSPNISDSLPSSL